MKKQNNRPNVLYRLSSRSIGVRRLMGGCFLVLASLFTTGCVNKDKSDLEEFVRKVKSMQNIPIGPLPDFPPDIIHIYTASNRRNPFENFEKPDSPVENIDNFDQAPENRVCLRPDMYRNKEHLEQFPLDSLEMVGFLTPDDDEMYALIQDTEGLLHQIRPGNYLGKNYGKVVAVTDRQVDVVEMIPDGTGCYTEREVALKIK